jgi:hypothetical protein
MDSWEIPGPGSAAGPDPRAATGFDAVIDAEQTVGDAWIGRLLLAESEAETILGACVRARRRAAERVQAARQAGDSAAHARSRTDLEMADTACVQAWEDHERAERRLVDELAAWSRSTATRIRLTRGQRV